MESVCKWQEWLEGLHCLCRTQGCSSGTKNKLRWPCCHFWSSFRSTSTGDQHGCASDIEMCMLMQPDIQGVRNLKATSSVNLQHPFNLVADQD
eukprot:3291136-Amphidinium_carterae.1